MTTFRQKAGHMAFCFTKYEARSLQEIHPSGAWRNARYNGAMKRTGWTHGARIFVLIPLLLQIAAGCQTRPAEEEQRAVTVYVSLDEPYSRPVLEAFTRETGVP